MQATKILAGACALLLSVQTVLAAPTLSSEEGQGFDADQGIEQLRVITITDDATTPIITAAGDLRVHIPTSFPAIWDDQITELVVGGTAFDAGRFADVRVPVTYEDDDKTLVVPVEEDFAAGEQVVLSGMFLEGFYWSTDTGDNLELLVTSGGATVAEDDKEIFVRTSSNSDTSAPEAPADVSVTQTGDTEVTVTWVDPPDMDTTLIQVLRGVSPLPVAGTAYTEVAVNTQTWADTDLKIGDTVSYILRATDGPNFSSNSEEVSVTLVADWQQTEEPEPVACTADYSPVCGSDNVTYSNSCNAEAAGITTYTAGECATTPEDDSEPAEEAVEDELDIRATAAGVTRTALENAADAFADLSTSHWATGFIARMQADDILAGYPDGTMQPDRTINRAEFAKMATMSFGLPQDRSLVAPFTDVTGDSWFAPFVRALKNNSASWTAGEEYLPAAGVSRGEAVWVIATLAGADLAAVDNRPFPDVSVSHPYASAIAWAKGQGIISGYDNGDFGTRDTLTRAQVAKMLTLMKELD